VKQPSAPSAPALARHPISVVVERTGLSQHLLRVWERRYGAVEPTRGEGGHRLYSDADIARLRLLHAATLGGRSIGRVARLATEELARIVEEDAAARDELGRSGEGAAGDLTPDDAHEHIDEALALTLALDAPALDAALRRVAARLGVTSFVERVAAPLLRRIGDEWHAGRLTIAQEHLASSTVHDILVETMRSLARDNGDARVVVATLPGDRHAIGAALAAAVAAAEGWSVVYLGPDVPAGEIAAAAVATGARMVAVSVVYVDDRERMLGELRTLRARLPVTVSLVVGGAGAGTLEDALAGSGILAGATLADLHDALRAVPADAR
jgi:methanogenic corrinoid protein MtbC1